MKKVFDYLKEIHSATSDASAKRFYGGIGYMMAAITIVSVQHDKLVDLLLISAGLIGLTALENIFKK